MLSAEDQRQDSAGKGVWYHVIQSTQDNLIINTPLILKQGPPLSSCKFKDSSLVISLNARPSDMERKKETQNK